MGLGAFIRRSLSDPLPPTPPEHRNEKAFECLMLRELARGTRHGGT